MPPSEPLPAAEPERWFASEVHAHDQSLRSYLHRSFPSVRDVDDVVQESYLRIWRAKSTQQIQSAKAFLFKVARHLALDLVRREQISPINPLRDLSDLTVLDDKPGVADAVGNEERVKLLAAAIDSLPPRCRNIVVLRKLKCLPQKEVAQLLGLAEKTVEAQLARGVARCEDYLRARGVHGWYHDETR